MIGSHFLKRLAVLAVVIQLIALIAGQRLRKYYLSQKVDGDFVNAVGVMGGIQESVTSQSFEGGHVRAIMGGVELDLSEAKIASAPVVMDATVICGGAMIIVPSQWNVKIEASSFLGGVKDLREAAANSEGSPPDVRVTGKVLFGGLGINSPPGP